MHSRLMTMLAPDGPVLASVLAKIPNLMALYVFGSQVQGTSGPESDLDLSVLAPGYIDPNVLWSLSNEIANLVNGDVDLLDLRAASTVMQYQVLSTGKTLWDIGLQARLFEVSVFSEKLALDEAREPLLRTITREGHVYAR
jgi:predicted nucleotidyltransferase